MKAVIESIGLTAGGGQELALDLISRLARHTEHQWTLIVPDLPSYQAISETNIRKIFCTKSAGLWQRLLLLNCTVPRICCESGADALLCLGNFPPRKIACPTTVLLHNPWLVYRDPVAERRLTLHEKLVVAYGRSLYGHLPGQVKVVAQTPVMRNRLCAQYEIDPSRVTVIPNTFSLPGTEENGIPASSAGQESVGPFTFLCLGHYYAHKNVDIILEAVARLPRFTRAPVKCVITIAPDQHPGARRLLEKLESSTLKRLIVNIGAVPRHALPQVYRSCQALLFPTLLESYSRTYPEAMHFGLPILTSDRDFAHHLCQDAAIYFDPLNPDSLARAMARVAEDEEVRRRLVENGRRVLAGTPTWDEIARRFVQALECPSQGEITAGRKLT